MICSKADILDGYDLGEINIPSLFPITRMFISSSENCMIQGSEMNISFIFIILL
jgi:hypothetical protein